MKNKEFAVSKLRETAVPKSSESNAFIKLLRAARERRRSSAALMMKLSQLT